MINVEEATHIILEQRLSIEEEAVPLNEAIGRVLREDLIADRDFPPYDRVTMDGIAIAYDSFAQGQKQFPIAAIAPAGSVQQQLSNPEACIEIMTGAVLPKETDTIIRYEDVVIDEQTAAIQVAQVKKGQNIHYKGEDRKRGATIVKAGQVISPAEVGVAATIGKSMLKVAKMPRSIIISTGDELVEIDEQPLAHQIRKSNVHRLLATLKKWGISADADHLPDDPDHIRERMRKILQEYDLIVLSGGVSKGKFDYIPQVLEELNVAKLFHRIRQRPGKPFWFGRAQSGAVIFALPGNPISSFMCTQQYLGPWLRASLGLPPEAFPYAILARDFHFKPDLTNFLQVQIRYSEDGQNHAHPVVGHGSGDLANLVDADGFLELPRGQDVYPKGQAFRFIAYR